MIQERRAIQEQEAGEVLITGTLQVSRAWSSWSALSRGTRSMYLRTGQAAVWMSHTRLTPPLHPPSLREGGGSQCKALAPRLLQVASVETELGWAFRRLHQTITHCGSARRMRKS
jgi:hypothetical protein